MEIDLNNIGVARKLKNSKEVSEELKQETIKYIETLQTVVNQLSLQPVMLTLPNDAEIDDIVHLKGTHKNTEFAEMCMREGAKLLRDKLKRSEA